MDCRNDERKPLIGITCHTDSGSEEDLYPGTPLNYNERKYADILVECGMIPVLIPVCQDIDFIYGILSRLDGLDRVRRRQDP